MHHVFLQFYQAKVMVFRDGPQATKTEDFQGKFQMAFDPTPPSFSEKYVNYDNQDEQDIQDNHDNQVGLAHL